MATVESPAAPQEVRAASYVGFDCACPTASFSPRARHLWSRRRVLLDLAGPVSCLGSASSLVGGCVLTTDETASLLAARLQLAGLAGTA